MTSIVSRRRQPRASWAEKLVRTGLVIALAIIGYVTISYSFAEFLGKRNPEQAYRLVGYNGRITADAANALFQREPIGDPASRSARLARLALQQDATAVNAVVVLGSQAQLRGDLPEARRLFTYSQLLSRRNLQTHIWMIEEAVQKGDIPGAIKSYDMALRTSRAAPAILYPVLAGALAEPAIRSSLAKALSAGPNWGQSFLAFALNNNADPRNLLDLFERLRRAGAPVAPEVSASLVNRLMLISAPDDAWRYYSTLAPGLSRSRSRDPNFASASAFSSPFDWMTTNDKGISVSIQKNGADGIVDFSVPPGGSGILLWQTQVLPPGTYRLSGNGRGMDQPADSRPYWTLMCNDGRDLGRVEMENAPHGSRAFRGLLTVPANCGVQVLKLVARPFSGYSGATGQILRAELRPE